MQDGSADETGMETMGVREEEGGVGRDGGGGVNEHEVKHYHLVRNNAGTGTDLHGKHAIRISVFHSLSFLQSGLWLDYCFTFNPCILPQLPGCERYKDVPVTASAYV